MKKKNYYFLIIIFISSLLLINSSYGEPTEYDLEQDDIIDNNIDMIEDNADAISDNANILNDYNENIDTNTNNISTLNNNAILYDINRDITLENNLTIDGDSLINGNLEVIGHIDPASLELIPQTEAPITRRGIIYYDDIDSEFKFRENGNWRTFGELDDKISNNSNRINDLDNRVGELEKTQYIYEQEFRIIDTKKWKVKPFIRTNFTRNKVDIVGIKATFKIGKSYEEKLIEKQNGRIGRLEALLEVKTMNEVRTIKTNNGWKIDTKNSPIISVGREW